MDVRPTSSSLPVEYTRELSQTDQPQRSYTICCHGNDEHDIPPLVTKDDQLMIDNRKRAAADHYINHDMLPIDESKRSTELFDFIYSCSSEQGVRPANEDKHGYRKYPEGEIITVCDGHGALDKTRALAGLPQMGLVVAQTVVTSIQKELIGFIREQNFRIKSAFESWTDIIQEKLPKVIAGTTAVIGFVEKVTGVLHVGNYGDSGGWVLRMVDGLLYPIPMTRVINWKTPECVERVQKILPPDVFEAWNALPAKSRYFPPKPATGVNITTTLGDPLMTYEGKTAISHEPICTRLQLEEGDLLVFACDGLFDFAEMEELIEKIFQPNWNNPDVNLAKLASNYALQVKGSTDNVTVMAVKVVSRDNEMLKLKRAKTIIIE